MKAWSQSRESWAESGWDKGGAEGSCQESREEGSGWMTRRSHSMEYQMGNKITHREKGMGKVRDFIYCYCDFFYGCKSRLLSINNKVSVAVGSWLIE